MPPEVATALSAIKDPAVLLVGTWLALEVRGLRIKLGGIYKRLEDHGTRLAVIEDRVGVQRPREAPAA